MQRFEDLRHAISVLLHPGLAGFKAERKLRLFEVARWVLLGGVYHRRKIASGIVYTAAEIACLGESPVDALRQALEHEDTTALIEATMSRFDFYHLLFVDDRITSSSMSKKMSGQLWDAVEYGLMMLSIGQSRNCTIQEDVLLLRELRVGVRGRTALKAAAQRYRAQLAFLVALDRSVVTNFLQLHGDKLLLPQQLIMLLDEQLRSESFRPYLSRVKAILELINPGMSECLQEAWPDLPPSNKGELCIRLLSEEEERHLQRIPRPAKETKKARRQRPYA